MPSATATTEQTTNRRSRREYQKPIAVPVNEACRIGGFGRTLCYELIAQGKLKAVVIGRRRLVLIDSIESLLRPDAA